MFHLKFVGNLDMVKQPDVSICPPQLLPNGRVRSGAGRLCRRGICPHIDQNLQTEADLREGFLYRPGVARVGRDPNAYPGCPFRKK